MILKIKKTFLLDGGLVSTENRRGEGKACSCNIYAGESSYHHLVNLCVFI